ncbi:MAG: hypothetical protein ACLP9L_07150 [Thermoguttaceae bacterium]
MNLVGKIFTVLIFLMCVVFGTFALMVHAAHKNWREVVVAKGGLNDQLTAASKLNRELTDEKKVLETALENEKKDKRDRLTALENEKKIVVGERQDAEGKLQVEEGKSRVLALAIQETSKRLSVLQTAIDGMRNDIKVAVDERNGIHKNLVHTTDELMNAVAERDRLEKLQRELVTQIQRLNDLVKWAKITPTDLAMYPPEGLEGEVTSVADDVVEISVGADDGVRKGHKFSVTHPSNGKYVGVIEVKRVDYPNRAVCRPDKAMLNDPIQKGDHVKAITKPR